MNNVPLFPQQNSHEIQIENVPELEDSEMKRLNDHQHDYKKKKKNHISKHIIVKFQNSKDKHKILNVSRREGKEKQIK